MRYVFLIIIAMLSIITAGAQSIEDLKRSIDRAQAEIDNGNKLLKVNASKASSALDNIVITNKNIKNRERIISSLNAQISIIKQGIGTNNSKINSLSKELTKEKQMYAQMMVSAYKRYLSNANLLFLFSSSSLQDLHLRVYYLHKYSIMKQDLAEAIKKKSGEILGETEILSHKQTELESKNKEVISEVGKLENEKKQYNTLHASLTKESRSIKQKINNNEKQKKALERKIQQIIEEEARAMNKKKPTEVDIKLSEEFSTNKGKLPFPVSGGTITEQFGTHRHPLYSTITVENKGINVAVSNNSSIKSVFDGEITRVFFIQGLNNSVMIRHGDYITVYAGLTVVNVAKGDKIKTGDVIGKISDDNGTATLHFEIYKGKTALDPETWLR